MKTQPLVSVVIPCFNHEKFVKDAILSVIEQSYKNIELIIIDDGSSDDSVLKISEMIELCERRFIRFGFRHRANMGLCATLNEALTWCSGVYFAPFASDDILRSYKIEQQVAYMESHLKSAGVFGRVDVIDASGKIQKKMHKESGGVKKYHFNDIFLLKYNLPAPSQMLRTAIVKKVGGYNKKFTLEDFSMWLAMTELGLTLDFVDRVYASYRRHASNTSSNFDQMLIGRLEILQIYKSHKNYCKAEAASYLLSAHEWQKYSKQRSAYALIKAFFVDWRILFNFSFAKYIIKFFVRW